MLRPYKTRFAPSPTGKPHLGNLRAALISYLWSIKNDAEFILRIDDTDTKRSRKDFIDEIVRALEKFDIKWSYCISQSARSDLYIKIFNACVEKGLVYEVCESSQELEIFKVNMQRYNLTPAFKKKHAKEINLNASTYWRFALEDKEIIFEDLIKGKISINLANFSDPVVRKANGDFTYTFASVVDDCIEKITHVIRGADHLSNTAVQIHIADKIFSSSILDRHDISFAHYPLFTDHSGNKMSKRDQSIDIENMLYNFHPLSIAHYIVFSSKNSEHYIYDNLSDLNKNLNLGDYATTNTVCFSVEEIYKWQQKIFAKVCYQKLHSWFAEDYKQDFSKLKDAIVSREDLEIWNKILDSEYIYYSVFDFDREALAKLVYKPDAYSLILKEMQEQLSVQFPTLSQKTIKKLSFNALRQILIGQKIGPKIQELFEIIHLDKIYHRLKNYLKLTLKLTDSIHGDKDFVPIDPSNVRIYACGPTLYDEPHIGNYRSFITFDILNRLLRHIYVKVVYTRNITDIDDKIIRASEQQNVSTSKIVQEAYEKFKANNKKLCLLKPDEEPTVTQHMSQIIKYIEDLYNAGYAYRKEDGIYFDLKKYSYEGYKYHIFSKCLKNNFENDDDFVLWKFKNDSNVSWESPFGRGRPGWHIECTVMSKETLNIPFDIHCGGMDLSFPHHTNENAQSISIHGEYAKYWLHNHFITFQSGKMSKSLGNVLSISQIKHHHMIVKLSILMTHYRSAVHWSTNLIEQAQSLYNKWRRYIGKMLYINKIDLSMRYCCYQNVLEFDFIEALSKDLNLPLAIRFIDQLVSNKEDPIKILNHCNFIGMEFSFEYLKDNKIINFIEELKQYKREGRYSDADLVKNNLRELGVVSEELKDDIYWYQFCY